MPKTIPGDFSDQYELDACNETWTLADDAKLAHIDGLGIHEGNASSLISARSIRQPVSLHRKGCRYRD